MPTYSTGELAKMAGVTVRTVQYYDQRGVLSPSELTSGGRRLYSDADVKKMQVICFLRDLGLSLNTISDILSQENSENVLVTLLSQRAKELEESIALQRETLDTTRALIDHISMLKNFSVDTFSGMAPIMKSQKELKKMRVKLTAIALIVAVPVLAALISTFVLALTNGRLMPLVISVIVWLIAGPALAFFLVPWYYKQVAYVCPECQQVFKPTFKEFFWAGHTPRTRKLTCQGCGHKGYCVEVYDFGVEPRI